MELSKIGSPAALAMAKFIAHQQVLLSRTELYFLQFYLFIHWQQMNKQEKEKPKSDRDWEQFVDASVLRMEKELCEAFLKAVREHNGNLIIEIANAAMFFKGKLNFKNLPEPDKIPDKERIILLNLKELIDLTDCPMNINVVVDFLEGAQGSKVAGKDDGYSVLRRKCKKLGLRLEPVRKIGS